MGTTYKVVIADDDALVRSALADLLDSDSRYQVVAQLSDGETLPQVVLETGAHVVLLDVRMPGGGTAAALALQAVPPVVVVAVSGETTPQTVADLVGAGVRGYLAKGQLGSWLPDVVARCLTGEVILAVPTAAQAIQRLVHRR